MVFLMICTFVVSAALFGVVINAVLTFNKPGMYPPKIILKKRIQSIGTLAVTTLCIGVFLLYIA